MTLFQGALQLFIVLVIALSLIAMDLAAVMSYLAKENFPSGRILETSHFHFLFHRKTTTTATTTTVHLFCPRLLLALV